MHCEHRNSELESCFPTSPSLVRSLILAGLSYGECQVPVTPNRASLNDTVSVVQDYSFGRKMELFWIKELTCMSKLEPWHPNLSERHSGTTCTFVSGAGGTEFVFMDDNAHPHRENIAN
ncbi:uncharacterized protein TNCV_3424441 [Trichonephila clavipes]|nr:uncharacterized protein TNCV_3424441 [Trichonephila clavipes]